MSDQMQKNNGPQGESAEEFGELTGHVYDGIQEYDNPTPGWWSWLFAGSFVFSILYLLVFHIGSAPGIHAQYEAAVANNLRTQFDEIGDLEANRETILKYMDDPEWIKVGEVVFKGKCASCHGPDGGGIVGPNLTDDNYKNVKQIEDIAKVIQVGAANGAMPAWQNRLHRNEIVLTASYVAKLRGTNPGPGARAAEGNVIDPWPEPAEVAEPSEDDEAVENDEDKVTTTEAHSGREG